jgi:ribosome maturation factor RimP
MRNADDALTRLTRSVVEPMGYELVGVEYVQHGKGSSILRVYIDHEKGINLDDCSAVSHQLSGVLDVEDPLPGHYALEVSSPGLDRPLFTPAHFARFSGYKVRLRLREKRDGRRNFEGLLGGAQGDQVLLVLGEQVLAIPLAEIESARLVPEY